MATTRISHLPKGWCLIKLNTPSFPASEAELPPMWSAANTAINPLRQYTIPLEMSPNLAALQYHLAGDTDMFPTVIINLLPSISSRTSPNSLPATVHGSQHRLKLIRFAENGKIVIAVTLYGK
jgi:hypothetical protein